MRTKAKEVERILTTFRQITNDRSMSKRYVLHILENKLSLLISQKIRDRSLSRIEELYTTIDCFEFEEIDTVKCDIIEFRMCESVMRSKKKLPDLIFTRYGGSVKSLYNLNYTIEFDKTTLKKFTRDKKRKSFKKTPRYYIKDDNHLYLVDSKMEVGTLQILTMDTKKAEELSCNNKNNCKSALDYKLIGTDTLIEVAVQQTMQELIGTYMQVQTDENPDNNENSI